MERQLKLAGWSLLLLFTVFLMGHVLVAGIRYALVLP